MKEGTRSNIISILLGVVIASTLWLFIARPFLVNGQSMFPSFNETNFNDYLIVNLLSYRFSSPRRGDVVVVRGPKGTSAERFVLKRVIGLPNETVVLAGGKIAIQTEEGFSVLSEPYVPDDQVITYRQETIPLSDDEYYLLGDNRNHSLDSRVWGAVQKDAFVGQVMLRLLPLSRIALYPGKKHNGDN